MALVIACRQPQRLLRLIYEGIDDGVVATWTYDSDGDLTHTSEQWGKRMWLHPVVGDGELVLRTIPRKSSTISTATYAYYHGHFAQMLLTHFDDSFRTVSATAQASRGDSVGGD